MEKRVVSHRLISVMTDPLQVIWKKSKGKKKGLKIRNDTSDINIAESKHMIQTQMSVPSKNKDPAESPECIYSQMKQKQYMI